MNQIGTRLVKIGSGTIAFLATVLASLIGGMYSATFLSPRQEWKSYFFVVFSILIAVVLGKVFWRASLIYRMIGAFTVLGVCFFLLPTHN
jgi:uncharacterized membrane protein